MAKRGEKTRCNGLWTEARFHSFITSALRGASKRWGPAQQCLTNARTRRGMYLCAGCGEEVPATIKEGHKRVKNIHADHIEPVVDPTKGFEDWQVYIDRMFVEVDGYQALCQKCHSEKTNEERALAKQRRANEKEQLSDV